MSVEIIQNTHFFLCFCFVGQLMKTETSYFSFSPQSSNFSKVVKNLLVSSSFHRITE